MNSVRWEIAIELSGVLSEDLLEGLAKSSAIDWFEDPRTLCAHDPKRGAASSPAEFRKQAFNIREVAHGFFELDGFWVSVFVHDSLMPSFQVRVSREVACSPADVLNATADEEKQLRQAVQGCDALRPLPTVMTCAVVTPADPRDNQRLEAAAFLDPHADLVEAASTSAGNLLLAVSHFQHERYVFMCLGDRSKLPDYYPLMIAARKLQSLVGQLDAEYRDSIQGLWMRACLTSPTETMRATQLRALSGLIVELLARSRVVERLADAAALASELAQLYVTKSAGSVPEKPVAEHLPSVGEHVRAFYEIYYERPWGLGLLRVQEKLRQMASMCLTLSQVLSTELNLRLQSQMRFWEVIAGLATVIALVLSVVSLVRK
jgi:hypothetical protein